MTDLIKKDLSYHKPFRYPSCDDIQSDWQY